MKNRKKAGVQVLSDIFHHYKPKLPTQIPASNGKAIKNDVAFKGLICVPILLISDLDIYLWQKRYLNLSE